MSFTNIDFGNKDMIMMIQWEGTSGPVLLEQTALTQTRGLLLLFWNHGESYYTKWETILL